MRIFIAALALALTLAACSPGEQTSNPTTPQPAPQPAPQPSPPSPPPVGATACPAEITVLGGPGSYSYSISSCTIKIGAEVTITANNTHPLNGSGLKTISAATTNQKLSFAAVGEFNFKCTVHGSMTGKITVVQ